MADDERLELARQLQKRRATSDTYTPRNDVPNVGTNTPGRTRTAQSFEEERKRKAARETQRRNAAQTTQRQAQSTMSQAEREAIAEQRRRAYEMARQRRKRG
jgi:hypothetical protein